MILTKVLASLYAELNCTRLKKRQAESIKGRVVFFQEENTKWEVAQEKGKSSEHKVRKSESNPVWLWAKHTPSLTLNDVNFFNGEIVYQDKKKLVSLKVDFGMLLKKRTDLFFLKNVH